MKYLPRPKVSIGSSEIETGLMKSDSDQSGESTCCPTCTQNPLEFNDCFSCHSYLTVLHREQQHGLQVLYLWYIDADWSLLLTASANQFNVLKEAEKEKRIRQHPGFGWQSPSRFKWNQSRADSISLHLILTVGLHHQITIIHHIYLLHFFFLFLNEQYVNNALLTLKERGLTRGASWLVWTSTRTIICCRNCSLVIVWRSLNFGVRPLAVGWQKVLIKYRSHQLNLIVAANIVIKIIVRLIVQP